MVVRKEVGEKFKRKPKMYMYMKETKDVYVHEGNQRCICTKHDDVDENSD